MLEVFYEARKWIVAVCLSVFAIFSQLLNCGNTEQFCYRRRYFLFL